MRSIKTSVKSTWARSPYGPSLRKGAAKPRRRALVALTAVAAVGGMTALGTASAGAASAGAASAGAASAGTVRVPWASGAWLANDKPSVAAQFGAWRGSPLKVIAEFTTTSTWNDVVNSTWMYKKWKGSPYTLAIAVPMLPTGVAGVSISACADGNYNSHWNQFGRVISSYGLGKSIIRLGWEFNGNWYRWAATQPATWAQCWRQIVTAARATAPGLKWDWNVNRGISRGLKDPTRAYPGNAYVDQIGVDSYDWRPAATTSSGWNTQLNGTQGLNYWLSFARAHSKKFAMPEWGSVSTRITAGAGGDDPAFVQDMHDFFEANAGSLAFEANLQGISTKGAYWPATTLPKAAARYRAAF